MIDAIRSNYNLSQSDAQSVAHIANGSYSKVIEIVESNSDSKFILSLFNKMMMASASKNIKSIKEIADEISKTGREVQKAF